MNQLLEKRVNIWIPRTMTVTTVLIEPKMSHIHILNNVDAAGAFATQ